MIALLAGLGALGGAVYYAIWKQAHTGPAAPLPAKQVAAATSQTPYTLTNGQAYTVDFYAKAGTPPGLGPTGWMPIGSTLHTFNTGVQHPSFPGLLFDRWTMQAKWNGPTSSYYAVNPLVAASNVVSAIGPASASASGIGAHLRNRGVTVVSRA